MHRSWWRQWFGGPGPGPGDAEALQRLLILIYRQETALACHLAERARAVRFAPDRLSLAGLAEREDRNASALAREIGSGAPPTTAADPERRPGTPTATKLIQDLDETEDLYALYRRAGCLTADGLLRGKLEDMAAGEGHSSRTIRRILAWMDSYVTDLP